MMSFKAPHFVLSVVVAVSATGISSSALAMFKPGGQSSQPQPWPMASSSSSSSRQDAPPAYEEEDPYEVPASVKAKHEEIFKAKEDLLPSKPEDILKNLQIVLVIDKSGSQVRHDDYPLTLKPGQPAPKSSIFPEKNDWLRWDSTFLVANYLAESLFTYDKDGKIPVIFFGNDVQVETASDPGELESLFTKHKPQREMTEMFKGLDRAIEMNITAKEKKNEKLDNTLFIVITDGEPNAESGTREEQEGQIKGLIYRTLTRRDPKGDQFNVLFIRVGDDKKAREFLEAMDDHKEIRGNVDTKSDNDVHKFGAKNIILNAIFEHIKELEKNN